RLGVLHLYWVGGFAAMDWVEARAYGAAAPDPLSEVAPGIVEHMNRDHADSLALFARVLAGEAADEATMLEVDRLGFKLRLGSGGGRGPPPRSSPPGGGGAPRGGGAPGGALTGALHRSLPRIGRGFMMRAASGLSERHHRRLESARRRPCGASK